MRLYITNNIIHLLLVANVAEAFHVNGRYPRVGGRLVLSSSTTDDQDSKAAADKPVADKPKKKLFIKNEREQIARKKDFYRGAGVFRDVKAEVTQNMRDQFDSNMMNEMKENPNYMMEKDGVEFYLAKEHGFCWGGTLRECNNSKNKPHFSDGSRNKK